MGPLLFDRIIDFTMATFILAVYPVMGTDILANERVLLPAILVITSQWEFPF